MGHPRLQREQINSKPARPQKIKKKIHRKTHRWKSRPASTSCTPAKPSHKERGKQKKKKGGRRRGACYLRRALRGAALGYLPTASPSPLLCPPSSLFHPLSRSSSLPDTRLLQSGSRGSQASPASLTAASTRPEPITDPVQAARPSARPTGPPAGPTGLDQPMANGNPTLFGTLVPHACGPG